MTDLLNSQSMAEQSPSGGQNYMGAAEVFEKMFKIFQTGNLQAMLDLFAEDAVMEFPFAPPNRPRRVEGKNNIIKYNQKILDNAAFTEMTDIEIYRTLNPDCVIVEMTGHGIILATGDTFKRSYIEVCRTENGRMKLIRDYWNPQESPKLSFIKKLKVAYRMIVENLKSRRHHRITE